MTRSFRDAAVFCSLAIFLSSAQCQDASGTSHAQTASGSQVAQSEAAKAATERNQANVTRNPRIMGGEDATIEDNPWQVALVLSGEPSNAKGQFCGGAIVAPRWVLTAAHCVDAGTKPSQIAILVGTASLSTGGHRVPVAPNGIYIYNPWDFSNHKNDIALVKTSEDLGGQAIKGWSLPTPEDEGRNVVITGWGSLTWQNSPPMSIILQKVEIQIVSLAKCNASDSYDRMLTNSMLCIGKYAAGQKDSCERDSGGPATTEVNGVRELLGLTSWGAPRCGTPKMPGVYTRVSQYKDWIATITANEVKW